MLEGMEATDGLGSLAGACTCRHESYNYKPFSLCTDLVSAAGGLPVVGQRQHQSDAALPRLVQQVVQAPEGSLVVLSRRRHQCVLRAHRMRPGAHQVEARRLRLVQQRADQLQRASGSVAGVQLAAVGSDLT